MPSQCESLEVSRPSLPASCSRACKPSKYSSSEALARLTQSTIVNIGGSDIAESTRAQLQTEIRRAKSLGHKVVLPDVLLYDDVGLQIWSDIIHLPDYYQFRDETEILTTHGDEIAALIPDDVVLIDLGAGDTTKVSCLISALTLANKKTTYLALDLSEKYLRLNCERLSREHPSTGCHGLWGTFSNGMQWLRGLESPRMFLSLGSVLCNDEWTTALAHLRSWATMLRPDDMILIGMDGHVAASDFDKIWTSYHPSSSSAPIADKASVPGDASGDKLASKPAKFCSDNDSGIEIHVNDLYEDFWRNGFAHANRVVGETWFNYDDWTVRGFLEQAPTLSHRFIFQANKDVVLGSSGIVFKQGEEFDWFDAHKYGKDHVRRMCEIVGLEIIVDWKATGSEMRSYIVKLSSS